MGGSSGQTLGYRYFMGLHMAICQGPVTSIDEIFVGERPLGILPQTGNGTVLLNLPELFGGDKKEGGIVGNLDLAFGAGDQTVNSYLSSQLGLTTPSFRGTTCAIFRAVTDPDPSFDIFQSGSGGGYLAAMSPYPKAWAFQVTDIPGGSFNPSKQNINGSANGGHIIFDCLTDTDWGLGIPGSGLDLPSFTEVTDALHAENFGLSFTYAQQSSMEEFLTEVLTHINAVLYTDRQSGKLILKLVRDDFIAEDLPIFDETNIASLVSFERPALAELVNEIVITYRRKNDFNDTSISVQDLGSIQDQEGIISQTTPFAGIDSDEVASLVALRELRQASTPLARAQIVANREAWNTNPGDVIKLSWDAYGIDQLIFRVAAVDYGSFEEGLVRIEAVEDIFGLPSNSYLTPVPSGWVDAVVAPLPAASTRVIETPYFVVQTQVAQEILSQLELGIELLMAVAENPVVTVFNFQLHTKIGGAPYAMVADSALSTTVRLVGPLDETTVTSIPVKDLRGSSNAIVLGGFAFINGEALRIDSIDTDLGTIEVGRGYLDTRPRSHPVDSVIYFADQSFAMDPTLYSTGDTVDARILTQSGLGLLSLAEAVEDSVTMVGRRDKPYPAAQVRLSGMYFPLALSVGTVTVTWTHQDRLQQLVAGGDDWYHIDLGAPEEGVLYTVRYYNADTSTLLANDTNLSGTASLYTPLVSIGTTFAMRIEVDAIRDGNEANLETFTHTFTYTKPLEVRTTENGDTRVLENGDRRILES